MPAASSAAVTPVPECREATGTAGVFSVYYGYVNPGPQVSIPFGDANTIVPGLGYQGQPDVFNVGSYPRVFKAVFNSNAFTAISWDLDGSSGISNLSTPLCASGATGVAGEVTPTSATLTGLVDPKGLATPYRFEYGTTIAYGSQTPDGSTSSPDATLVSAPLTGLLPGTTYHYRLVTEGATPTAGEDATFTTLEAPAPPPATADLALTRSARGSVRSGRKAVVTLTVRNAGPSAAGGTVVTAAVPRVLRLRSATTPGGSCTGKAPVRCEVGAPAPGAAATVRLVLKPRKAGTFAYSATAASSALEPAPGDNLVAGTLRVARP